MTQAEYAKKIQQSGNRPSPQRIAIYAYIAETKNHPTAETVYQALSPKWPTLSRTTVYNTIHAFCQSGLLQSLNIEDDELRYDADISFHMHFKCRICKKVYDIFTPSPEKALEKCKSVLPKGFKAEQSQIIYWGMCPDCSECKNQEEK